MAEADVEAARAEIGELSRRLVTLERRLRSSTGRLAELRSAGDAAVLAGEHFERIVGLPLAAGIDFAGTAVRVRTQPIEVAWDGRRYLLGEYRLTLDFGGDVRVDSLAHLGPKPSWDHPHVQDGLPCLGNLRPGILKLIAEFELALAVQLLLDFLVTYQPESAYTPIEGWPEA
ncbi:MAG TPA: hypothetical protein VIR57_17080 [Chloroflexota bacterium]